MSIFKRKNFLLILLIVFAFLGCENDYQKEENNKCDNITCSGHGDCTVNNGNPTCSCENDYHPDGLNCIKNSIINPCDRVNCSNHGNCKIDSQKAICNCYDGYHSQDLSCIKNSTTDSCEDVNCGKNGKCVQDGSSYYCECEDSITCRDKTICQSIGSSNTYYCVPTILMYTQWSIQHSDFPDDISLDDNNNIYILSGGQSYGDNTHLTKFDSTFTKIWIKDWKGRKKEAEYGDSMDIGRLTINNNKLYVVDEFNNYINLIKFNTNGDIIYNNSTNKQYDSYSIAADDNNIYITGKTDDKKMFFAKFDMNGIEKWFKKYPITGMVSSFIKIDKNKLYISGYTPNGFDSTNEYEQGFLIKLDINGNEEWKKEWKKNNTKEGRGSSMVIDDNYIYLLIDSYVKKINISSGEEILKYYCQGKGVDLTMNNNYIYISNSVAITKIKKSNFESIWDTRYWGDVYNNKYNIQRYRGVFFKDKYVYVTGRTNKIAKDYEMFLIKLPE